MFYIGGIALMLVTALCCEAFDKGQKKLTGAANFLSGLMAGLCGWAVIIQLILLNVHFVASLVRMIAQGV